VRALDDHEDCSEFAKTMPESKNSEYLQQLSAVDEYAN
jgi:hypothetical protein